MSITNISWLRTSRILLLAGTLAMQLGPDVGMAQSVGPFAVFSGKWRGSGQVTGVNGNREHITCRADYTISPNGQTLSQSLVCASDSYRFDVRSNVDNDGDSVRGEWEETTRNVKGNLLGQIADGEFSGKITGSGFSADMSLKATGGKQEVSISPHGSDVAKMEIELSREK
jgi:hypothetical protein